MADYSKIIAEIRRNNEELNKKLEEKERQALQKRQEEEERQRKLEEEKEKERKQQMQKVEEEMEQKRDLIRDKVISYLLKTIKENQKLDKKVEKITLGRSFKQEIEVVCKNINNIENPDEIVKNSISYEECFAVRSIKQIHWAFGLRGTNPLSEYNENEKDVADGLFRVILHWDGSLDFLINY